MNELTFLLIGNPHPVAFNECFDSNSIERLDKKELSKHEQKVINDRIRLSRMRKDQADKQRKITEEKILESLKTGPKTSLELQGVLGYTKSYTNSRLRKMLSDKKVSRAKLNGLFVWTAK